MMKYLLKITLLLSIILLLSGCNYMKDQARQNELRKHIKFIETYPDSTESAIKLMVLATTFGKEKTAELYQHFSTKNKESEDGKIIAKFLTVNRNVNIGEPFADFEMEDQNGITRKLSDSKGKIILLEFWASWCGGCQHQMPHLVKTYERFKNNNFEIFAVSYDQDKNSWVNAIDKGNLNWQHVSELKSIGNTAGLIYGVSSLPDNFLIDKNGIIIGRDLRGDNLNKKLDEILRKN